MRKLLAVLVVGLLVGADAKNDKADGKLDGTWTIVSAEKDGKERAEMKGGQLIMAGKELTMQLPGGEARKAAFTTDAAKKTIDVTPSEGNDANKTASGIYSLAKDELKICIAAPGGERPTEFSTKDKSGVVLLVLKREKK